MKTDDTWAHDKVRALLACIREQLLALYSARLNELDALKKSQAER